MSQRPELDLVTANAALTFPANVQYNFVYWAHEGQNVPNVVPHLRGNHAIALESASDYDQATHRQWRRLFAMCADTARDDSDARKVDHIQRALVSRPSDKILRFAYELRGEGTDLFLIDRDGEEFEDLPASLRGNDLSSLKVDVMGSRIFDRESLVIRQLSQKGYELAAWGTPITMGVLEGANHHVVSVAARLLGANVTRRFVNPPEPYLHSTARSIEYSLSRWGKRLSQEEAALIKTAEDIEYALPRYAAFREMPFLLSRLSRLQSQDSERWQALQTTALSASHAALTSINPNHGILRRAIARAQHKNGAGKLEELLTL